MKDYKEMKKGWDGLQGFEEGLGRITGRWRRVGMDYKDLEKGWEELLGDGEGLG